MNEHSPDTLFDLAIIGGGVNGCGIARDAAGRGLSVVLFEKGDLAEATSSSSTKLFHGGLRYLENFEFRLVREALIEREVLLRAMPHIARPLRFVLPHHDGLRPAWMLRLGLFLYDHLGGREILPGTRTLDLRADEAGKPLEEKFRKGFEYSDCWIDDARLVALNARDAAQRGADIRTRTRFESAERGRDAWTLTTTRLGAGQECVRAKILVNAGGPWVDEIVTGRLRLNNPNHVRLVRGSHIVVRRLYDHPRAYIFQNADGRVVFAIPYEHDFTLIGTTDADYSGDPAKAVCTPQEADYLCAAVSEYFVRPVTPDEIVWTFSGVRPLYDDGASSASSTSRDYMLTIDRPDDAAPLLNVFGGKITTYRRLAEAALDKLAPYLPSPDLPNHGRAWTHSAPLPGGDLSVAAAGRLPADLARRYSFLDARWASRLARCYGTDAERLLGAAERREDLGRDFGASLTQSEVDWLIDHEMVQTAEDILWRRTKLGLRMDEAGTRALETYLAARRHGGEARVL